MTPEEKWNEVLKLRDVAWQMKTAFIRSEHPDWNHEQVEGAVRKIFLYATT